MYIVQPKEEKYIVLYRIIFIHICVKRLLFENRLKIQWKISEKQRSR